MNSFYPLYYQDFECIGGVCKHNCCIGWEIDIDLETYEKYKKIQKNSGNLEKRLEENISTLDTPHFILGEEERCPFLNGENLCDIILEKGEDFLCQICSDHPRFRNFFTNCTEVGLGLCCEEAARLVLSQKEPFSMPEKDATILSKEEQSFFRFRNDIFRNISNRTLPLSQRISSLCEGYGIEFPQKTHQQWAKIFLSLEHLDESWVSLLEKLRQAESVLPLEKDWELPLEQLFSYMIYRHLAGGLEDGCYGERILFAVLSVEMISWLASLRIQEEEQFTFEHFIDLVRLYSSEIEYSEENTESLLLLL